MRLALSVNYLGDQCSGWQIQPDQPSLAACLNQAVEKLAGHTVQCVASGRTDTGVHALSQVVHIDVEKERDAYEWQRGIQYHLPDFMAVDWVKPVDSTFHARFSALARRYVYLIYPSKTVSTLHMPYTLRVHQPLDWAAMQEAAALLVGRHDFTSFRSSQCQAKTPIRHVSHALVYPSGDCWVIDIAANAFLHHMIRNIVGSLLMVGKGEWTPQKFFHVFQAKDRQQAAAKISAQGLFLCEVLYPKCYALPQPKLQWLGFDFTQHALESSDSCLAMVNSEHHEIKESL